LNRASKDKTNKEQYNYSKQDKDNQEINTRNMIRGNNTVNKTSVIQDSYSLIKVISDEGRINESDLNNNVVESVKQWNDMHLIVKPLHLNQQMKEAFIIKLTIKMANCTSEDKGHAMCHSGRTEYSGSVRPTFSSSLTRTLTSETLLDGWVSTFL
jgi:hypothetical protein